MADHFEVVETVFGRQEGEILKSYLRAQGIDCELSQEGAGYALGLTVDGMGAVQILVPSLQTGQAREALERYRQARPEAPASPKKKTPREK
jgi:hypothetical protein